MKKIFVLFLAVISTLLCTSCFSNKISLKTQKKPTKEHDAVITEAIDELKDYWEERYEEEDFSETDGYFEIKNTRIITLKENDIEVFEDVKYIVEFSLYTDYFGSAPYYQNVGVEDTVVVYQDGTMEVKTSLIRLYSGRHFVYDYSNFIRSISDYHGYYNCTEKLI